MVMSWFRSLRRKVLQHKKAKALAAIGRGILGTVGLEIVNLFMRDNSDISPEVGREFFMSVLVSGDEEYLLKQFRAAGPAVELINRNPGVRMVSHSLVVCARLLTSGGAEPVKQVLSDLAKKPGATEIGCLTADDIMESINSIVGMFVYNCVRCIRRVAWYDKEMKDRLLDSVLKNAVKEAQDVLASKGPYDDPATGSILILLCQLHTELLTH